MTTSWVSQIQTETEICTYRSTSIPARRYSWATVVFQLSGCTWHGRKFLKKMSQRFLLALDWTMVPFLMIAAWNLLCPTVQARSEECHLRPVIHVLQQPGCIPKPIPSFACQGSCSSYVQVSGSKFWQVERSCMCCQEMGEREANIGIFCPKATPRFRKIVTRAPVECMCRPCTAVDESAIKPQEVAAMMAASTAAEQELMGDMPAMEDYHMMHEMHMGKDIPVV